MNNTKIRGREKFEVQGLKTVTVASLFHFITEDGEAIVSSSCRYCTM
jgi:hypothetical protein